MKILQKRRDPRDLLPLRPAAFAVLATLADGPRPGIEILDGVNATLPGRRILGPGTLYRLMRELRQDGLVERDAAGAPAGDDRQAPHVLTALGRSGPAGRGGQAPPDPEAGL